MARCCVLDVPVASPSRLRLSCRLQEGRQRYDSRGLAEPEVKRRSGVRYVDRLVHEGESPARVRARVPPTQERLKSESGEDGWGASYRSE